MNDQNTIPRTVLIPRADPQPQIWVACLAAYNAGQLHGRWINTTDNVDVMQAGIDEMLAESPQPNAEEWAIFDYEGFADLPLSESESLERVSELAEAIERHGDAFVLYAAHVVGIDYATLEAFDETYAGCWPSLADYAQHMSNEYQTIPSEWPFVHIDWEQAGEGLVANGDIRAVETTIGVYIWHAI